MAKSRFAHLFTFTDEEPAPKPVPVRSVKGRFDDVDLGESYGGPAWAKRKLAPPAPEPARLEDSTPEQDRAHAEMLGHDRMLFEGLLLRYGKRWILAELARCLKKFPSYRKDD